MKITFKIIPFLILIFFVQNNLFSQNEKFKFGFNVGGGLAFYDIKYNYGIRGIDTSYSSDQRFCFKIGAFMQYDLIRNFGIKAELQFSRRGGSISTNRIGGTDSLTAVTRTYTSYIDYLNFELLPQVNLIVSEGTLIYFNTGGYFSLKVGSMQKNEETTKIQYRAYEQEITNNLKAIDLGLTFGIGIDIMTSKYFGITAGIKYNLGLQNILDIPDVADKIKIRNNSLMFCFGILGM